MCGATFSCLAKEKSIVTLWRRSCCMKCTKVEAQTFCETSSLTISPPWLSAVFGKVRCLLGAGCAYASGKALDLRVLYDLFDQVKEVPLAPAFYTVRITRSGRLLELCPAVDSPRICTQSVSCSSPRISTSPDNRSFPSCCIIMCDLIAN